MSEFLKRVPGCHVFVGAAPQGVAPPMHHAPDFQIDERALQHAIATLAGAAELLSADG
jgi:metal-dependent amidase/aminoacylase/carboxypeptidase family protein